MKFSLCAVLLAIGAVAANAAEMQKMSADKRDVAVEPESIAANVAVEKQRLPDVSDESADAENENTIERRAFSGGVATFFYQGGQQGACGEWHSDDAHIVALDTRMYGKGGTCGSYIRVKNNLNGKSVKVRVVDECPTCQNAHSIDLSVGAFNKIANAVDGQVPVSWYFV